MQITQDYYDILGITPSANAQEINQAYRKLAFQFHPDRNQNNPEANRMMQEINEAYETLANPLKKRSYDLPLEHSANTPKFKAGNKVTINKHSPSPYRNHAGIVDKDPVKDVFRFWYAVRVEMNGYLTIVRFAEEELDAI